MSTNSVPVTFKVKPIAAANIIKTACTYLGQGSTREYLSSSRDHAALSGEMSGISIHTVQLATRA